MKMPLFKKPVLSQFSETPYPTPKQVIHTARVDDPSTRINYFANLSVLRSHSFVRDLVREMNPVGGHIVGGYARWACSPRSDSPYPGDVDIAVASPVAAESVKRILVKKGMALARDTVYATTYALPAESFIDAPREFQVLKGFLGPVGDRLEGILSTISRIALVVQLNYDGSSQIKGYADHRFAVDEQNKTIRLVNVTTVAGAMAYCTKYAAKGYKVPWSEHQKILKRFMYMHKNQQLDEIRAYYGG